MANPGENGPFPTDRWIATAGLAAPDGVQAAAVRLVLLLHYGIDWRDGWVAKRRDRYWDRTLPDYIIQAAMRHGDLGRFWSDVTSRLGSSPRNTFERAEVIHLLADAHPQAVLEVLRDAAEAVVLFVRLVAERVRETRASAAAGTDPVLDENGER